MILLCGIPSEAPIALVVEALRGRNLPHVVFNQREFDSTGFWFSLQGGRLTGALAVGSVVVNLDEISGVYVRLMDHRALPEFQSLAPDDPARARCQRLHDALYRWLEVAPARIVNRLGPMASNSSKPYQAQLIARHGFHVPQTVVTNDPDVVRDFLGRHDRVIYKSASGVRSIVQEFQVGDEANLDQIRWCPTQFQEFVPGVNTRVHVVGDEVFATRIETSATDYRYAARQGGETTLSAIELQHPWPERCVSLATALELPFAGIDLKLTPTGEVYCFEVNPSPGFSYYEHATGQPISDAVARHLAGVGGSTLSIPRAHSGTGAHS